MRVLIGVVGLFLSVIHPSQAGWIVKKTTNSEGLIDRSVSHTLREPPLGKRSVLLRQLPAYLSHSEKSVEMYEETLIAETALPYTYRSLIPQTAVSWQGSEVRTLVNQGPATNRINLTFVGDGYTSSEKERFFEDAQRLTEDLFGETTFASYLPLFNVYAVFVPSAESGLTDGKKKVNTALGLFRSPAGSKRGIMPGKMLAIEKALRLAPAMADYPILVANDDYYGGLGGRYAITTRSHTSGSMVLRHELGHNFGEVGEEYDGGYVYRGANSSQSRDLKWNHWQDARSRFYETQFLGGEYIWADLAPRPIQMSFDFPEGDFIFSTQISTVGWATPNDVEVRLDGQKLEIVGEFTSDRSFFELQFAGTLAPGRHKLEFEEKIHDGDNVLAFANIYALEGATDFSRGLVGGFMNFNSNGRFSGYRPTHDTCLMRNMRSKEFCSIDLENMWNKFLSKVRLIDSFQTGQRFEVTPLKLDGIGVEWAKYEAGVFRPLPELKDHKQVQRSELTPGRYRVQVRFETEQVREIRDGRFTDQRFFDVE